MNINYIIKPKVYIDLTSATTVINAIRSYFKIKHWTHSHLLKNKLDNYYLKTNGSFKSYLDFQIGKP